jgi:hypothetical protein
VVDVAQEPEREVELLPERLVRLGGIEGDAEDLAVAGLVCVGLITQAVSFDRSAGGVGLRVPPEQDPPTALVGERDRHAILIGHGEVGCG